jgi:hypothetical protein
MARIVVLLSLLAAPVLAGCGGDGSDENPGVADATVTDILEVTPPYTREAVSVSGTATPIADLGFVLTGEGRASIFVDVPPALLESVSASEEVSVTGVVQKLPRTQEARLEAVAEAGGLQVLADTPVSTGDPFINAESVDGVDLKSPQDPPDG